MDSCPKVLVAEDFTTMRKILCNVLKEMGFAEVLEAEDGEAAWELIGRESPGLVVTGWHMPNLNGLELVRRIRACPDTASVPVLMVSIEGSQEYILAAFKAGANDYLVKPFTPEAIKEKVEGVLRRKGER